MSDNIKTKSKNKKPPKRKDCVKCEKSQALGNFYNANSSFFPDNKLHVCKDCALNIAEEEGFEGFQSLMRMINKPIYEELYKGDIGDYVRQMNSLPQYRKVIFTDSDMFKEMKNQEKMKRAKPKELTETELKEAEDYFGRGYEESDYIFLKYEMDSWSSQYDMDSKALEDLIKEVCLTQLDIRKRRGDNRDVDKQLKTLQDLLGSSNLKPMQETGNQAGDIHETFGGLIRKFENERPIPEPDDAWRDVDGIGKYIRTFFFGHMAKLLGKENKFQHEYDETIGEYTVNPHKDEDD